MAEERLKLVVFVDFDNIQIGVKDTLGREFDVSLVLEALKERGEVVTKIAYGDWHRSGDQSRQMTQHAVQLVQRHVTPRGDKNGADINLALDALEMAFSRPHINAFAIVGGDSDFITLVEKLKQYDKRVFVVGGRAFTSNILQRNCHEFIAYENLLKAGATGEGSRPARSTRGPARPAVESRQLSAALLNVQRALKILAEREVAPQLGLLKSTLLQLDSTFSERDYGAGSFLEFIQKMEREGMVRLRRTDRSFLVEPVSGEADRSREDMVPGREAEIPVPPAADEAPGEAPLPRTPDDSAAAMGLLKPAMAAAAEKAPNRPLYLRQIRQALRSVDKDFDARRYGFRGILDLLHQAQREGWMRLQRDRKGVLRIFPVVSGPTAPPAVTQPAEEAPLPPEALLPLPEATVEEAAPLAHEVAPTQPLLIEISPPATEPTPATEAAPARKTRKLPTAETARRRTRRGASISRKPPSGKVAALPSLPLRTSISSRLPPPRSPTKPSAS